MARPARRTKGTTGPFGRKENAPAGVTACGRVTSSALRGRRALFVEEAAGLVRVDGDAGAHRRGERDLLQVAALGGGRLQPDHLVDRRRVVLEQRLLVEGGLADDEVQVPVPVLGLGIRPRGPSTLPSLRTSDIASVVAMATSKSDQPSLHFWIMSV